MYCLSFSEGCVEMKSFYYHNFLSARTVQRKLLIIEINHLLKEDVDKCLPPVNFENMTNEELNRVLNGMIKLNYHVNDYLNHVIDIEVNKMTFEDLEDENEDE
jgi:hypothetical protein